MKILGVTDEVTTCECCGKKNLKKTIALETAEGVTAYYGSECASAALTGKKSRKGGDAVSRLAAAISFVRDNMLTMKVDEMHSRLTRCAWANVAVVRGAITVWNDAGRVEVGA